MNKKNIFAFVVVIIFFLVGFLWVQRLNKQPVVTQIPIAQIPENITSVEIGGQKVKVDLALTEAEQEQGLSGRPSLLPNTGMLFVFPSPLKPLFWMKDMNFPIDMIWITEDMKVDYIENDATPESYPATFGPGVNDGNAEYVLEVPNGFAAQNNLKVGDSIQFIYQ